MLRLAGLLVVVVAACGGSDFKSGAATLTSITPTVMSSGATSFTGADGSGRMVLGWTIDFFDAGVGADCLSSDTHVQASIGIFTSQEPDATHKRAMLTTGDIVLATSSPPTVAGNAAASMGAEGIGSIVGTVNIGTFHLRGDGTPDRIDGTVSAGGMDGNGTGKPINGTFAAPICE